MVAFPPCKVNLGLQILARRTDGYHSISTCFYPVPWTDVLEILPSDKPTFVQTGILIPGDPTDNLCIKAYHLLKNDFALPPVQIHLHKNIPTGAGLGGGSSDAAHTIRLLNVLFKMNLAKELMLKYASAIGSDCSFFIQDDPAIGSGKGELLETVNLSLKNYFMVVLTPEIHVSTSEAYSAVIPHVPSRSLPELLSMPIDEWRGVIENDFEASIFLKFPLLKDLKEKLYSSGATYACMSGSGSSIFGLFKKEIDAKAIFKDSFGWAGKL